MQVYNTSIHYYTAHTYMIFIHFTTHVDIRKIYLSLFLSLCLSPVPLFPLPGLYFLFHPMTKNRRVHISCEGSPEIEDKGALLAQISRLEMGNV